MLISSILSEQRKQQPDKIALIHGEKQWTYDALAEKCRELASYFVGEITVGEKVLLQFADPEAQLIVFLALVKAGAACLLADEQLTEGKRKAVCAQQGITKVYLAEPVTESIIKRELPVLRPEDFFLGALTSGTSGEPKVIWRSQDSWISAFSAQSKVFGIAKTDVLYIAGGLSYTSNLNAVLHMLAQGGRVVLAKNKFPRTWLKEINGRQVTSIFMVPANYRALLKVIREPVPQVRSLVTAGAKIDGKTVKELLGAFPQAQLTEYYGAGELGYVSYAREEDILDDPCTVGRPFPGVNISLDAQQVIWVESPYLAPGVQPKATAGDLGCWNANGLLTLFGRRQDIINVGGAKIYAGEVERVLNGCAEVSEAFVQGVADELRGEKICAWVVKAKPEVRITDIMRFCHAQLPAKACPQKNSFCRAAAAFTQR